MSQSVMLLTRRKRVAEPHQQRLQRTRCVQPLHVPTSRTPSGGPRPTARPRAPGRAQRPVRIPGVTAVDLDTPHNLYCGFRAGDLGLFVATYAVLPVGTVVLLRLDLPALDRPRWVRGKVRWQRLPEAGGEPGIGVAFIALCPQVKAAMRALARWREPIFYV